MKKTLVIVWFITLLIGCAVNPELSSRNKQEVDRLTGIIQTVEDPEEYYYKRGKLYYESGFFKEAEEDLLRGVSFGKKDTNTYFYLGRVYQKTGDYNKAKNYFKMSTEVFPNWRSLNSLANIYSSERNLAKALENYNKAIDILNAEVVLKIPGWEDNLALLYQNRGMLYYKAGEDWLSLNDFKKYKDLSTLKDPKILNNIKILEKKLSSSL